MAVVAPIEGRHDAVGIEHLDVRTGMVEALSETFEEREERVGWPVSAGLAAERGRAVDRSFFERGVGVLVDVGGLDALVPEPQRDRGDVDAGVQERIALVCRLRGIPRNRHYVDGWVMWPAGVFPLLGLSLSPVPAT